ncbi:hypothetical protein PVAND_004320 [Polypedilum vanderplanki]|uniref:Uncharacterized protein n=1 Tax=Polypedilum vanderplanki TaxID=319348 RepID=A0A9J6BWM1_POLVA|nr:hypothetical protein PVAND_004320 [Polypedilum vanderplanki]
MGLPRVDKFLCCISLETGCLIIGWMSVIISILAMTGLSLTLALYGLGIAHISQQSLYHIIFLGKLQKPI